jgi:putative DNA primase/helicase
MGEPPEVRIATTEYRDEMDVLGDFLAECCVVHPDARAASQYMYAEYRRWATDAGERVLPQKRFSQWMEHRGSQVGFRKQHTNQGKTWVGLGLALAPAVAGGGAESE